ncbi:MAG: hypothetical protein Tsb0016_25550 [Sphingomonadales bacterium]
MTLEQVQDLIAKLYERTGQGDWDGAAALLTDDFYIIEADDLPFAGRFEGKNALKDLFTQVMGIWDDPALVLEDVAVSQNNAFGVVKLSATSKHSGERITMEIAERFILRDGKVAAIMPYYYDTGLVRRATGLD